MLRDPYEASSIKSINTLLKFLTQYINFRAEPSSNSEFIIDKNKKFIFKDNKIFFIVDNAPKIECDLHSIKYEDDAELVFNLLKGLSSNSKLSFLETTFDSKIHKHLTSKNIIKILFFYKNILTSTKDFLSIGEEKDFNFDLTNFSLNIKLSLDIAFAFEVFGKDEEEPSIYLYSETYMNTEKLKYKNYINPFTSEIELVEFFQLLYNWDEETDMDN